MNKNIKNWIDKNITTDFKNKNVLITGGNSGIGLELAKHFAYLGSNIYLLIRSLERGEAAKQEILKEFPSTSVFLISLDLASFESIRNCVEEIKKIDVDIFINNAGVYRLPKSVTKDGFEIVMGTNYLGTLYLNDLILPYFSNLKHEVKVLFTSSVASRLTKIDLNDFFMDKKYKPLTIYGRSKFGLNCMYFNYLEEYKDYKNIKFYISHPGGTYTPLIKKGYRNKVFEKIASIFMKIFFHSPSKASLTSLYALNNTSNGIITAPRGLFEISGYPHITKFKKDKNYKKYVETARILIQDKEKSN